MFLNINANAIVTHTATLEKLHRSALPVAVRGSLNSAAFDVKTNTMPKTAKKAFVERSPTFFKSQSKVAPAKGFDIKTMQSEVGFIPSTGVKELGRATQDLKQQENSGKIGGRTFVPMSTARVSNSSNRRVANKNRLAAIKKIVDTKNSTAKTAKGKFLSSAIHAGKGGYVIGNILTNKGNRMLMRINSVKRIGGNTIVNSTPLYSTKKGRAVSVKRTNFMKNASNQSGSKIEKYYIEQATKQVARLMK